jgi:hypothetical protein
MPIGQSYFRFLDKKVDYANAHGFQVFIETLRRDILSYIKAYYWATNPDMSKNAVFQYIRYIFARYQANAVFLGIIHFDCLCPPYGLEPQELRVAVDGYYNRYGNPPFGQIVTTNVSGSTYRAWGHTDKAPWLMLHQVGNSPRDHTSADLLLEMFRLPNPIPAYHQEPWYISDDTPEDRKNRSTMYGGVLDGGVAGIAYEAKGLTRGNRESGKDFPNMWVAIKWRSADEVTLAQKFITAGGRYQDLAPHPEFLSVSKSGKTPQEGWAYCMRTDDQKVFKVYFEKNAVRPDLSGALPNTAYQSQWFDPRTGAWSNAGTGTLTSDAQGRIALPAYPSPEEDWAMGLTAR